MTIPITRKNKQIYEHKCMILLKFNLQYHCRIVDSTSNFISHIYVHKLVTTSLVWRKMEFKVVMIISILAFCAFSGILGRNLPGKHQTLIPANNM